MNRIKVVSDITDLVPVLRAVDSDIKIALFDRLSQDWITEADVKKEYGSDGLYVLGFFDRMKLVESRWTSPSTGKEPVKSFHTYYSTVSIN
ncbi:MAG: ArsR family transcriptional regulator, partial [Candidatus Thermoplasmatota archaeon]|nr:ArsR family transcriptional regulator [Candidatus Thermoplasmatota archaeon]